MFSYAIQKAYLADNPIDNLKIFPVILNAKLEYFRDKDLELIWKTVDPFWVDHLNILQNTGIRKGELINLKWSNVSLSDPQQQITITNTEDWQTKSGRMRIVPLNDTALTIMDVRSLAVDSADYLYEGTWGKSIFKTSNPTVTSVDNIMFGPISFRLFQNYPNPFNPTTTIQIDIPKASFVKLKASNDSGKKLQHW